MRVIAGQFRSRVLVTPRGSATRPTSDRLRETLFNVLSPRIDGARFADLYAGSGAVGIEALSRGAAHCSFFEQAAPALQALRKNLAVLGLAGQAAVDTRAVGRGLAALVTARPRYNVVFLDPPYEAAGEYVGTLQMLADHCAELLAEDAVVIAEHARRDRIAEQLGALRRTRLLEQGDAALSFYASRGDE